MTKIDFKMLNELNKNKYSKIKDGIYDAYLFKLKYKEVGEYNIASVEFHFKIGNKKTTKLLLITNKNGYVNKINKNRLDRYLQIITGEYPTYSNRRELSEYLENFEIGDIPVQLTLITPVCSLYQNFNIEFEDR